MDKQKESSIWPWIAIFVSAGAGVVILWLISWALITRQFGENPMGPGEFGDMFGAVNALFSGLAFAGVILAILLQRQELKLQREELARSSKAQEAQERALVIAARLDANVALLERAGRQLESTAGITRLTGPIEVREKEYAAQVEILLRELTESAETSD